MLCGGRIRDFSSESMTEADNMYKKAIELGIPETSIIIEKNSQNTIENILCSLLELQCSMWLNKVKNVLLVTTTYHMFLLFSTHNYAIIVSKKGVKYYATYYAY